MSEAAKAILRFAKEETRLAMVNAVVYPENDGSHQLAERMGFTLSGEKDPASFGARNIPIPFTI